MARRAVSGLRTLVTGASSGIGEATAWLLAERNCAVVGSGREARKLAAGPCKATIARDLTEPGAPAEVVEVAVEALGGLDVVVSCAGAGWLGRFEDMTPAEIDALIDINLRAVLHLAHAAGDHLRASPAPGQLVLVGSIAGLLGVPEETAYATAKAGLRGLADSLRAEWQPLTVTLVSPGPVDTPFFTRRNRPYMRAWPRRMPVDDVARVVVEAIEHRRSEVVVPAWLSVPARFKGALPSLYLALARRFG